jgi:P27 family predicted phage terminase small subunit
MKNLHSDKAKAPKHLSAEARGWWDRIMDEFEFSADGLLLLESGLEAFDRMRQAQAVLDKEGITVTDRFGQAKVHPAALIERDAKGVLLRYLKALGLDLEPLPGKDGR